MHTWEVASMIIDLSSKPTFVERQYIDCIGDYKLYYNPSGYGGMTVVDTESQNLIDLCNGSNTIEQIIKLEGRPDAIVMDEINTLIEREVVSISKQQTKELHEKSRREKTFSCWLHLTNSCNLACSYCYIRKTPGNMSLETGMLAIDKMVQSCIDHSVGNIDIKFSGGEPLLRFELLKKLVDYSQSDNHGVNVSYSIVTNATLVTPAIAKYLKDYNFGMGVSLDGISKTANYNRRYRNGKNSFDNVINGINLLRKYGNNPLILITVSSQNYQDLLETTKFCLDNDYRFRFSLEKDCETGWPMLLDNIHELIKSLHSCYDYMETNLPLKDISTIHVFGDTTFSRPICRSCGAGGLSCAIGHNRKLGLCGMGLMSPFSSLDQDKDIIDDIRQCNTELANCNSSKYPICCDCIWVNSCSGGCPLQTKATFGTFNLPSPYCKVYKEILPRILRIKGLQMIRDF